MVYPGSTSAPPPCPDFPAEVEADYREAAAILSISPRGAAALLRLSIERLCRSLELPGKNLNKMIGAAVKKGLPVAVQRSLDVVRVVGNNAVHPGQIDLKDNAATASALFRLVNIVGEKLVSEPKELAEIYSSLPQEAKDAIDKRDGSAEED